jgi:NADH dehydrogenase
VDGLAVGQQRDNLAMTKTRVLILGGGFGGLYAALEFEKRSDPDFEVTLISQENFFLLTPMLHEVAASDLDVTHIVNLIRKLLRYVRFFEGEVQSVQLAERRVVVAHGFDRHTHSLEYDPIDDVATADPSGPRISPPLPEAQC